VRHVLAHEAPHDRPEMCLARRATTLPLRLTPPGFPLGCGADLSNDFGLTGGSPSDK
jgi:hypothetical protein